MIGMTKLTSIALCMLCVTLVQSGSCGGQRGPANSSQSVTKPRTKPVEEHGEMQGNWGGEGVAMDVGDAGATIEFDCAHGTISESILLSADGKFSAKGTYAREHPGPVRQGEDVNGKPAVYSGSVNNETMTMKVVVEGTNEVVGPYTLAKGKIGRIRKCG